MNSESSAPAGDKANQQLRKNKEAKKALSKQRKLQAKSAKQEKAKQGKEAKASLKESAKQAKAARAADRPPPQRPQPPAPPQPTSPPPTPPSTSPAPSMSTPTPPSTPSTPPPATPPASGQPSGPPPSAPAPPAATPPTPPSTPPTPPPPPAESAPRAPIAPVPVRRRAARSSSRIRVGYILGGILLAIVSVGAFIVLLQRTEPDTITVLVANEVIAADDEVFSDDFTAEEISLESDIDPELFLRAIDFIDPETGQIRIPIAASNIPQGAIAHFDMLDFTPDEDNQRRVLFSIEIPSQGLPTGSTSVGQRILMIAYIPQDENNGGFDSFEPLLVEQIRSISGSRFTFFTTPDEAASLQARQLSLAQDGGYLIVWQVPDDQDAKEIIRTAIAGFDAVS